MKLYAGGYLTFYMKGQKAWMERQLTAPTLLKDILGDLQIPIEEVHLAALNGDLVDLETAIVQDTDVVRVFSSVNGG